MATGRTPSALRQIHTLLSLGRVGDLADGQLLEWFTIQRAEAEMAFAELVTRHGPMVWDVCRRVLGNPNDAEDAFQATFLILVRRAGSVRDRDALGGWLHRVALRVALRAKADATRRRAVERQAIEPQSVADAGRPSSGPSCARRCTRSWNGSPRRTARCSSRATSKG